jgi:hypothetical protein
MSNDTITFESGGIMSLFIPANTNPNFNLSSETTGYAYTLKIGSTPINVPDTNNKFQINISNPIDLNPLDSIQITIDGIKTNLTPRNSFIKFDYSKASSYADGHIIIPVSVQPMVMEKDKVTAYFNNQRIELSNQGYKHFYAGNKLILDLGLM